MRRKSLIMKLALATITGMPLVAVIIDRFSETVDLRTSLIGVTPLWQQFAYGAAAGLLIAIIAQWLISSPLLHEVNVKYANVLGRFDLTFSEMVFLSICAGVGEEMLFRGAIQPFYGILVTSVFFVAIHGYINIRNWRLSVYGVYLVGGIYLLGHLAITQGLIAAIIGHTVIDIYLLYFLQKTAGTIPITENPNLIDDYEENENDTYN